MPAKAWRSLRLFPKAWPLKWKDRSAASRLRSGRRRRRVCSPGSTLKKPSQVKKFTSCLIPTVFPGLHPRRAFYLQANHETDQRTPHERDARNQNNYEVIGPGPATAAMDKLSRDRCRRRGAARRDHRAPARSSLPNSVPDFDLESGGKRLALTLGAEWKRRGLQTWC